MTQQRFCLHYLHTRNYYKQALRFAGLTIVIDRPTDRPR